jgi:hypothetical protein
MNFRGEGPDARSAAPIPGAPTIETTLGTLDRSTVLNGQIAGQGVVSIHSQLREVRKNLAPPGPVGPPVVDLLVPREATLGEPSFTLRVIGSGFTEDSVIFWNNSPELTTYVSPSEVTTGVNMGTAVVAIPIPVVVQNGEETSNVVIFTLREPVPGKRVR